MSDRYERQTARMTHMEERVPAKRANQKLIIEGEGDSRKTQGRQKEEQKMKKGYHKAR